MIGPFTLRGLLFSLFLTPLEAKIAYRLTRYRVRVFPGEGCYFFGLSTPLSEIPKNSGVGSRNYGTFVEVAWDMNNHGFSQIQEAITSASTLSLRAVDREAERLESIHYAYGIKQGVRYQDDTRSLGVGVFDGLFGSE